MKLVPRTNAFPGFPATKAPTLPSRPVRFVGGRLRFPGQRGLAALLGFEINDHETSAVRKAQEMVAAFRNRTFRRRVA